MRESVLLLVTCLTLPFVAQAQKPKPVMPGMPGMRMPADTSPKARAPKRVAAPMAMTDSEMAAMGMPVPMPKGMPMIPGLVGLLPPVSPFLPGAGVKLGSLPAARASLVTPLSDGATLDLTAMLVRRTVKGHAFAMYAFNGQVPGPMIRVPQGATITVRFHNRIELPSAVHWHGVRLDNRFDGVPGLTQDEVAPGKDFTYTVHFPDAGTYWYHPHVREDIQQGMGLFGTMRVDSPDREYYSPVNREQSLVLDDLLVNGDTLIPFGRESANYALMGRVGNVLLVNGEPRHSARVKRGAVVRYFITNVSSSRTYNLSFGGAPIKVVASDVSRFEREERIASVVIAPAERYVVEVRYERAGRYAIVNAIQSINHYLGEFDAEVDTLGSVAVENAPATPDYSRQFATLRANDAISRDIEPFRRYFSKAPDKTLRLTVATNSLPLATVQFMNVDTAYFAPVEWVDGMPDMNWLSTGKQVRWILRDEASGKENMDIDWHVKRGSVMKIRIFNDPKSFHPMQHPIHLHGQRMLVVARDGRPMTNLSWKDTALIPVGSTVDLLVDVSNPGAWMLHCHIAEHLEAGMMTVVHVDP
ncbi:MAG: multicopper oxidase family protein [Gemmatimonadaceae bacterium]